MIHLVVLLSCCFLSLTSGQSFGGWSGSIVSSGQPILAGCVIAGSTVDTQTTLVAFTYNGSSAVDLSRSFLYSAPECDAGQSQPATQDVILASWTQGAPAGSRLCSSRAGLSALTLLSLHSLHVAYSLLLRFSLLLSLSTLCLSLAFSPLSLVAVPDDVVTALTFTNSSSLIVTCGYTRGTDFVYGPLNPVNETANTVSGWVAAFSPQDASLGEPVALNTFSSGAGNEGMAAKTVFIPSPSHHLVFCLVVCELSKKSLSFVISMLYTRLLLVLTFLLFVFLFPSLIAFPFFSLSSRHRHLRCDLL